MSPEHIAAALLPPVVCAARVLRGARCHRPYKTPAPNDQDIAKKSISPTFSGALASQQEALAARLTTMFRFLLIAITCVSSTSAFGFGDTSVPADGRRRLTSDICMRDVATMGVTWCYELPKSEVGEAECATYYHTETLVSSLGFRKCYYDAAGDKCTQDSTASVSQPGGLPTLAPNGHLVASQWCHQPMPSKPKVHTNPLDRP
jgi:hypothetical protein